MEKINKRKQFNDLKKGFCIRKKFFLLQIAPRDDKEENFGLAIITGKKIGNAVKRNKIRRWIKEFFRQESLLIPNFFNYLVITRKGIFNYGRDNIIIDLKNAIKETKQILK